jgi:hypothetical protein
MDCELQREKNCKNDNSCSWFSLHVVWLYIIILNFFSLIREFSAWLSSSKGLTEINKIDTETASDFIEGNQKI